MILEKLKEDQEYSSSYWDKRSHMMYYQYVKYMVQALAADANSMIDVGSSNAEYVESFDWIPQRHTIDLENPYYSDRVQGFEMDFMQFQPTKKYDFITCLQVLEHVPDPISFARKLFDIGKNVLISVPYMWEESSEAEHIHDPVDFDKLSLWTGRDPSYHIIVKEPLFNSSKSNRLICYYHSDSEKFDVKKMRLRVKNMRNSSNSKAFAFNAMNHSWFIESIHKNVYEIFEFNEKMNRRIEDLHLKMEAENLRREYYFLKEKLKEIKSSNQDISSGIKQYEIELKDLRRTNQLSEKQKIKYDQLYMRIINSKSWRLTEPARRLWAGLKRKF